MVLQVKGDETPEGDAPEVPIQVKPASGVGEKRERNSDQPENVAKRQAKKKVKAEKDDVKRCTTVCS